MTEQGDLDLEPIEVGLDDRPRVVFERTLQGGRQFLRAADPLDADGRSRRAGLTQQGKPSPAALVAPLQSA